MSPQRTTSDLVYPYLSPTPLSAAEVGEVFLVLSITLVLSALVLITPCLCILLWSKIGRCIRYIKRQRRLQEVEKERILTENELEEGFHEPEEDDHRACSESIASSRRTMTDTTSTTRWSNAMTDVAGLYVLPSIPRMQSIEEEDDWESTTNVL